jgi:tRNA pseudouridine13 synthase
VRLTTAALPGTGGLIKATPEDFFVDELPAYPPSGEGAHTFLHLEKRALTTDEALVRLCSALGVRRDDAGAAGYKDRQAVCRQWVSLPGVDPTRALEIRLQGLRVLAAQRHNHKLRTGHLRGNRFTIVVRGTPVPDALARARAVMQALSARGMPNYYGAQRFGQRGDNAQRGKVLVTGGSLGPRRLGRSERRLLISAYQSELFNRYLDRRFDDGVLDEVLLGDVMKKRDTGGLFTVAAAELEPTRARLAALELSPTGPLFGHKMMSPPPGTPAHEREATLLVEEGLTAESFASVGPLAEGTRRPLRVPLGEPEARAGGEPGSLVLAFTLPPGAYATVVIGEVLKTAEGPQGNFSEKIESNV